MCGRNATNFFSIRIEYFFSPGYRLSFAISLVKIGETFGEGMRFTQTVREMEQ